MRIAMLCSGHLVTDSRITYKQAASLAKAGHEVVVYGRESKEPFSFPGVTLKPIAPAIPGLWYRLKMIPKIVRAARESGADILTCHEPESALAALIAARKLRVKVLFDVHELFHESLSSRLAWPLRPIVRQASILLLKAIGRRVDWVTVVSPPNQRFYLSCRKDGRVDIVENSPYAGEFPLSRQDGQGPVLLCHEGYINAGRGLVQMLEALKIAREQADVRLLLLGRVEPCDVDLYQKTVEDLGIKEWIDGPTWVPYDKVGDAVARAQIGLVTMQPTPNNYLSLSNKIYSYMACGQPAIVPIGSATADLISGADCGIAVDTTKSADIAQAMVKLAKDAELRKKLGANGRRAIEQVHSWEKMEDKLYGIYDQLYKDLQAEKA